jgi:ribosomal-protein-alanine N-acetyltransferase
VPILETQRLLLRHLRPEDLQSLYALYRDPEIRRYFPDGTRTLSETKEELEWFLNGHPRHPELGLWATVEKETGAFVGRCGLLPWTIDGRPEVELAYLIDKARWGEAWRPRPAAASSSTLSRSLGFVGLSPWSCPETKPLLL